MARSGDAMDVVALRFPKGASKGSGKKQDTEVELWCFEKKGHRASECRKKQKDNDNGKSEGSETGDSKGKNNKKEFESKCCMCGNIGHMSKDCRSKETSASEAGDELAETGCTENGQPRFEMHWRSEQCNSQKKITEYVLGSIRVPAVTVFWKSVADDYPMLHTPGKAKSYRPALGKLLLDLCGHAQSCAGCQKWTTWDAMSSSPGATETSRRMHTHWAVVRNWNSREFELPVELFPCS